MSKPWWRSKTLWANFIAVLTLIADAVTGGGLLVEHGEAAVGGLAAVNAALRAVTRTAIR